MWKSVFVIIIAGVTFWCMIGRDDEFNWDDLSGKNILVTGASSGIGEEIAYTCAKHGANVVITARREQLLKKIMARCKEISPSSKMAYIVVDMGDMTKTQLVIETVVKNLGGLDMMFLNHALISLSSPWTGTKQNLDEHDKMLDVNYKSFVHLTAYALPYLAKTNGSIGVVGSSAGRVPNHCMESYSASKFALDGFFGALRLQHLLCGVNVSITYGILGWIGTDSGMVIAQKFAECLGMDLEKSRDQFEKPATPVSAAEAIIKATYMRDRELYFPSNQNLFLATAMRILTPSLIESQLEKYNQNTKFD